MRSTVLAPFIGLAVLHPPVAPAQEVAYVTTAEFDPSLLVVDPGTGNVLASFPVSGHESMFGGITFDGTNVLTIDGFCQPSFSRVLEIETGTGVGSPLGTIGACWGVRTIAVHPRTGVIYASTPAPNNDNELYTIDPLTGAATFVAQIDGPTMDTVQGVAIDARGVGYAVDLSQDGLFTFDLATGVAVHLGAIKWPPGGFLFSFRDLAFDREGSLWAVGSPGNGGLFRIDLATLKATQVLPDEGFAGVAFRSAPVETYCEGSANSQGCTAAIGSHGLPSAADPIPFVVTAARVLPNEPGMFVYGLGSTSLPIGAGLLCAGRPLVRTPAQVSAGTGPCGGSYALDFNAWLQNGNDPHLAAGVTVFGQFVYRDPGGPGGAEVGLSDAIEFHIAP